MIFTNGALYTLTFHAEQAMKDEKITVVMITETLEDADRTEVSDTSNRQIYDKALVGQKYPLRVVVDEASAMIVTVFFVIPLP